MEKMLSPGRPGDHNQAMMELGATVCYRQNPLCTVCPVGDFCAARRTGDPEAYPRLAPRKLEKRTVFRGWCIKDGALLLERTEAGSRRLADLHELPTFEALGLDPASAATRKPLAKRTRGITRFSITEYIHTVDVRTQGKQDRLVWIGIDQIEKVSLSGPHRRWVTELLAAGNGRDG